MKQLFKHFIIIEKDNILLIVTHVLKVPFFYRAFKIPLTVPLIFYFNVTNIYFPIFFVVIRNLSSNLKSLSSIEIESVTIQVGRLTSQKAADTTVLNCTVP